MPDNWEQLSEQFMAGVADSALLDQIRGAMGADDEIALFQIAYHKDGNVLVCDDPAAKTIVVRGFTRRCPREFPLPPLPGLDG